MITQQTLNMPDLSIVHKWFEWTEIYHSVTKWTVVGPHRGCNSANVTISRDVQIWLSYPEMIKNLRLLVAANNIDKDILCQRSRGNHTNDEM